MSYTNEPWLDDDRGHGVITNSARNVVATANRKEDVSRIVACINACAGIPNDDLEQATKAGGLFHLASYADEVTKQRDELLAALEKCAMFKLQPGTIQQIVNRAIASVKGGAA